MGRLQPPAHAAFGTGPISEAMLCGAALPVRVYAFFSTCSSIIDRLIMRATGDWCAHCGLRFVYAEKNTTAGTARADRIASGSALSAKSVVSSPVRDEYMEARQGGVREARTTRKLLDWAARDKSVQLEFLPLPMAPEDAGRTRLVAQTWVGSAAYGDWQLVRQLFYEKWGWPVPRTMGQIVCCEFLARSVYPVLDLRSSDRDFDSLTPGSVYRRVLELQPK